MRKFVISGGQRWQREVLERLTKKAQLMLETDQRLTFGDVLFVTANEVVAEILFVGTPQFS